jgi:ribonuclease Z
VAYEDDLVRILWGPLKHTTLCLGYRFEEHPRPGKFKTEAAKALGIPYGPLWGKLQRGETVTLDQGEPISPNLVLGPPRPSIRGPTKFSIDYVRMWIWRSSTGCSYPSITRKQRRKDT